MCMILIKQGMKVGKIKRDTPRYVRAYDFGNNEFGINESPSTLLTDFTGKPGRTDKDVILLLLTNMTNSVLARWQPSTGTWV